MSQPAKRKADAAASEAAASKRASLRSFHAGPNPVAGADDGQEHKDALELAVPAAAASSSSVRRLDISLRCVFGWLDLADLHRVLSVSKQWSANVCAMPSIGARVRWSDDDLNVLSSMCASSLARHVASLEPSIHPWPRVWSAVVSDLARVSERMSGLRHLHVQLVMPNAALGPGLLAFPQRLTKLDLQLVWRGATADAQRALMLQRVMDSIGALASLEEISLDVQVTDPAQRAALSFEAMRSLHRLLTLHFSWIDFDEEIYNPGHQTLTAAQLDCVRYLAHSHALVTLNLFGGQIERLLDDMTARNETKPLVVHHLWLGYTSVTAAHASALRCFPQLRTLASQLMAVVDFLPSLPHLRTLTVCLPVDGSEVTADQLVSAIQQVTRLTKLGIGNHPTLSEEHLTRLLASLPLIGVLDLASLPQLHSLSFLSSGAITRSLTSFTLFECRHADLRTSELRHLHACKLLTSLRLYSSFSDELSAADRLMYEQRPCVVLPALATFSC